VLGKASGDFFWKTNRLYHILLHSIMKKRLFFFKYQLQLTYYSKYVYVVCAKINIVVLTLICIIHYAINKRSRRLSCVLTIILINHLIIFYYWMMMSFDLFINWLFLLWFRSCLIIPSYINKYALPIRSGIHGNFQLVVVGTESNIHTKPTE